MYTPPYGIVLIVGTQVRHILNYSSQASSRRLWMRRAGLREHKLIDWGLHRDIGKENGNYYTRNWLHRDYRVCIYIYIYT